MFDIFARLSSSPLTVLYASQAATYVAAAILSRRAGHRDLSFCYSASALLHWAFAACHLMRFD